MKLIEDWKIVIHKAWSMRLAFIGLLIGFADQLIPQLQGMIDNRLYLALFGLISVARMIQQESISGQSQK